MRVLLQRVTGASVSVVEEAPGEAGGAGRGNGLEGGLAIEPAAGHRDEREAGRIGPGAVALAGFAPGDDPGAIDWMAAKIADLRIFPGAEGASGGSGGSPFDLSLRETGGELLVVSQFTLYGDARKGRRPDFVAAAPYGEAQRLYDRFVEACARELPGKVASGEFGATMRVALVNDGPVTLWLER